MTFSYNTHLLLGERVEEVGNDIIQKYPFIDLTTAKKMTVYNMVCKLIYSLLTIFFCEEEGGKKKWKT